MFTIIFSFFFCIFCILMFQILEVVFSNYVVTIFNLDLHSIEVMHSFWPWFHCFCSWLRWPRRKYFCIFFWSQCFQVQLALVEAILLMIEWKHPTSWWKDSWLLFEKSSMLITFTQTCTFPSFATWFFVTQSSSQSFCMKVCYGCTKSCSLWCWCHVISTFICLQTYRGIVDIEWHVGYFTLKCLNHSIIFLVELLMQMDLVPFFDD